MRSPHDAPCCSWSRGADPERTCRAMAHARGVWAVHTALALALDVCVGGRRVRVACMLGSSVETREARSSPRAAHLSPHLLSPVSCGCVRVILASRALLPYPLFTVVACTRVASSPAAAPARAAARPPRSTVMRCMSASASRNALTVIGDGVTRVFRFRVDSSFDLYYLCSEKRIQRRTKVMKRCHGTRQFRFRHLRQRPKSQDVISCSLVIVSSFTRPHLVNLAPCSALCCPRCLLAAATTTVHATRQRARSRLQRLQPLFPVFPIRYCFLCSLPGSLQRAGAGGVE